ncbi:HNH endonuclease signature motif containing protein [Paenibacillus sp. GCM10027627]|uniref:HNH endonuclease signature motif containing protein n=1 Tax=unclassified Paenibacillus TaxID=185978 RepID=UPI00362D80DB
MLKLRNLMIVLSIVVALSLLQGIAIAQPITNPGQQELEFKLDSLVKQNIITEQAAKELSQPSTVINAKLQKYNDYQVLGSEVGIYAIDRQSNEAKQIASTENNLSVTPASVNYNLTYRVDIFHLIADVAINLPKFVTLSTVTKVSGNGSKPTSYTISTNHGTNYLRQGLFVTGSSTTKNVKLNETVVLESPISQTKYWRSESNIKANFSVGHVIAASKTSEVWLANKKGVRYPTGYTDQQSKIVLWEPPTNLTANPRTPGNYRSAFIAHYESTWGAPLNFTWDDVQIHHMKPVKYNGPDSVSNLIPLWRPGSQPQNGIKNHSELTTWWANY